MVSCNELHFNPLVLQMAFRRCFHFFVAIIAEIRTVLLIIIPKFVVIFVVLEIVSYHRENFEFIFWSIRKISIVATIVNPLKVEAKLLHWEWKVYWSACPFCFWKINLIEVVCWSFLLSPFLFLVLKNAFLGQPLLRKCTLIRNSFSIFCRWSFLDCASFRGFFRMIFSKSSLFQGWLTFLCVTSSYLCPLMKKGLV